MLNKITYPTGGNTTFEYEINQYRSHTGVIKNAGGLRIYRIISDNGYGNIITKKYKYGVNEDGAGVIIHEPIIQNMISHRYRMYWGQHLRRDAQ